ncbi:MAG: hypothetical protein IPK97_10785 [Ahniella sp.]|nr:hypothetical protein [Ahniella sp.]
MARWFVSLTRLILSVLVCAGSSALAASTAKDLANDLFRHDSSLGAETKPIGARLESMLSDEVLVPTSDFARGLEQAIPALQGGPLNKVSKWTWQPVLVGLSADAQHGFTAGFQRHVLTDGTKRRAKYLAYWIRVDDAWRIKAYRIVPVASGKPDERRLPDLLPATIKAPTPAETSEHRITLSASEKAFSNRAQAIGLRLAFTEFGRSDSINLGGSVTGEFVRGAEAIAALVAQGEPVQGSSVHWDADEATTVASSGDLGVTFGFIRFHEPTSGTTKPTAIPFFTVWKKDGPDRPWRYVAE